MRPWQPSPGCRAGNPHTYLTWPHGTSDHLTPHHLSDISAAAPTPNGTPNTFGAWSALLHNFRLHLRYMTFRTESCSDLETAVVEALALTLAWVWLRSWRLASELYCCAAPGACSRLLLPPDSSINLASSPLKRTFSCCKSCRNCSFICIHILQARSTCSFFAAATLASISQ